MSATGCRHRVAHLTSVHRPMDTRILYRECASLAAAGFEVTLVAAWPGSDTGGEVMLRSVPRQQEKWQRLLRTVPAVARIAWDSQHDLYHLHDPELVPLGLALRLRGRRVVYDAHEDLPEQLRGKAWIPPQFRGVMARLGGCLNWVAGRGLSGVVAATDTIARSFPVGRTCTVQNFPNPEELSDPAAKPYEERDAVIVYVGDLTVIRGVCEATAAMGELPPHLEAQLKLAGTFNPPALMNEVSGTPGWERVEWLGFQDRGQVRSLLAEARVGLVTLHPLQSYRQSQPVKLFEYMVAGLPVIASDFPEWLPFLDGGRAGLVVDPLDPSAIAEAIEWMLTHPEQAEAMGRHGREVALRRFSWDREAEKLIAFYDKVLHA